MQPTVNNKPTTITPTIDIHTTNKPSIRYIYYYIIIYYRTDGSALYAVIFLFIMIVIIWRCVVGLRSNPNEYIPGILIVFYELFHFLLIFIYIYLYLIYYYLRFLYYIFYIVASGG